MKKIIITSCLFFYAYCVYAQDKSIETEIRKLEQTLVQAVLDKDTATLKRLWDRDYIVNNPDNKIVFEANPAHRPVLQRSKFSFTSKVKKILINGDIVISMGSETVVTPGGDSSKSGQTVKRRYTNIWMKKNGSWKVVARHANEICK